MPNCLCWTLLQAAQCSPQDLQVLWRLPHVVSMNPLSSVKKTGCQQRVCQFWCSLANTYLAARCWAVSTGFTCRCRTTMAHPLSPFLTLWAETCTWVACWRSFCRALAVFLAWYWPISWYLLRSLDNELENTENHSCINTRSCATE